MPVDEFRDPFPGSSLDSRWTARTSGSGTVTVTDGKAVLDEGGTANGDVAGIVLTEPLDLTVDQRIDVCVSFASGTAPGRVYQVFGIWDGSAVPNIGGDAGQDANQRLWVENQTSSGSATFNRWQYRFKNSAGTQGFWNGNTQAWTTGGFAHSHSQANEDNYMIFSLCYSVTDGWRVVGYGFDAESSSDESGMRMRQDTGWIPHGTGTNEIDPIDNDPYLVIGDLVNNNGGLDHVYHIEYVNHFEVNGTSDERALIARATTAGFAYELHEMLCPSGLIAAGHPLWVGAQPHPGSNVSIAKGSDNWVQNAHIYHHTDGNYYCVYSRQDSSGDGHIAIRSASSMGTGWALTSWGSATTILSYNDSGFDAGTEQLRFPKLYYEDSAFWLFVSSEETSPNAMKLYRATTANSDPEVAAWGSVTKVLSPSGTTDAFDQHGVGQCAIVKTGSTFVMTFGGYNDTVITTGGWAIGFATASAIDGTWTKDGGNPILDVSSVQTQIDGSASSRTQTVDSSTGFSAGMPVVAGAQTSSRTNYRPSRIRSVPDGTTVELYHRLTLADNHYLTAYHHYSVAPCSLRQLADGTWEMWCTVFKFGAGEETVGRFLSDDVGSPEDGTWAISTDDGFPWVGLMKNGTYDDGSCENIGIVIDVDDFAIPAPSLDVTQTATQDIEAAGLDGAAKVNCTAVQTSVPDVEVAGLDGSASVGIAATQTSVPDVEVAGISGAAKTSIAATQTSVPDVEATGLAGSAKRNFAATQTAVPDIEVDGFDGTAKTNVTAVQTAVPDIEIAGLAGSAEPGAGDTNAVQTSVPDVEAAGISGSAKVNTTATQPTTPDVEAAGVSGAAKTDTTASQPATPDVEVAGLDGAAKTDTTASQTAVPDIEAAAVSGTAKVNCTAVQTSVPDIRAQGLRGTVLPAGAPPLDDPDQPWNISSTGRLKSKKR